MRRDGGSVFPAHANTVTQIGLLEAFPLMSARLRADIHDGPELSSNQRSDTLMQDRSPPTHRIFLLRTAGPYIWVISGHWRKSGRCPLYPQKRTLELSCEMSAWCQKRTSLFHRGERSLTIVIVLHTDNWLKAACVDRPGPLDLFQERGDPRKLQFAALRQTPKHLSRVR